MMMERRQVLQLAASTGVLLALPPVSGALAANQEPPAGEEFSFATVRAHAERLAAEPYRALEATLPEGLADLTPAQ